MKAALYPNFQKKNALLCAKETSRILHDTGIDVSVSEEFRQDFRDCPFMIFENMEVSAETADFVIAIGGDGTILRCAKYLMGKDTKMLGINTGTLGFMAGLEADQLDQLVSLKTGDYTLSSRMTIDVVIHEEEGDRIFTALNEVSARSGSFHISDFEVYSDGYLIGRHRADGILFSTPSGSTAYALSAGGPVIEPDLECIEMTLICPHSLFSRATLFAPDRTLKIVNVSTREEIMVISIDGEVHKQLKENDSIEIRRGKHDLNFINIIGNSFHESLCRKMCKPIK